MAFPSPLQEPCPSPELVLSDHNISAVMVYKRLEAGMMIGTDWLDQLRHDEPIVTDYMGSKIMANQEGVHLLTGMEREFSDMRSAIANLRTGHHELRSRNHRLESVTANLQSDNHELKCDYREMKSLTAKLQSDNHELKCDYREMKSLTAKLQSDNHELKSSSAEWKTFKHRLRYSVIEARWLKMYRGTRDDELANKRNEMVHGGDIISDLEVIQHLIAHKHDHSHAHKAGIQEAYGITFDDALEVTPTAPKQLIEVFNIRASVTELYSWQRNPMKREIQGLVDNIIAIALAEPAEMRKDLFAATDGRLAKRYENLVSKYEYRA